MPTQFQKKACEKVVYSDMLAQRVVLCNSWGFSYFHLPFEIKNINVVKTKI